MGTDWVQYKNVSYKIRGQFSLKANTDLRVDEIILARRTVFRSQRSQGCAGSNPVLGTTLESSELSELSSFLFPLKRALARLLRMT
jgi:hypothetical protein